MVHRVNKINPLKIKFQWLLAKIRVSANKIPTFLLKVIARMPQAILAHHNDRTKMMKTSL